MRKGPAAKICLMAICCYVMVSVVVPVAAHAVAPPHATRMSDQILDPVANAKSNYSGTANIGTFQQDGILTHAGWQYVAWYRDDQSAIVSRRQLPSGNWQSIELDFDLLENDSHNAISMAVSPSDGRLHIAFGQHAAPTRYTRSVAGLASNPESASWVWESFSPTTAALPGVTNLPARQTYPTFEVVRGRLLLTYREGGSTDGRWVLLTYDDTSEGAWTYHGSYSNGDGSYTSSHGTSFNRNGYLHGFEANPTTGDLEIVWTYREGTGSGGCLSHDLYYATSPDLGMTWYDNAGKLIGITGSENQITIEDDAKVVGIANDVNLINQESAAVDGDGRMHVITSQVPADVRAELGPCPSRKTHARPFHHWRDDDGVWRSMQLPVAEYGLGRSNILFDKRDTAIVVLPNASVMAATAKSGWTDWKTVFAATDIYNNKETIVDRQRLGVDGTLSVAYQEASSVQTLNKQSPAAFRVADFRIRPGRSDRPKDTMPQQPPVAYDGPGAYASSHRLSFVPELAFDGDAATRWVSKGENPGDGPTATSPETLTYISPDEIAVSEVTILPPPGHGPKDIVIEARVAGAWRRLAEVVQGDRTETHQVPRTEADGIRLVIKSAYDSRYPDAPRNVHIAELEVSDGHAEAVGGVA